MATQSALCQTSDDVKDLLTNIFKTNSYNKNVRPTTDQTSALQLSINLFLVSIIDIDEVKGKLTATAYLELKWTDEHMIWSSTKFNGVNILYIPQNDIWKPDIALSNGFNSKTQLGDDLILVIVESSGELTWFPYEVLTTTCYIDVSNFPFDTQTCDIAFDVWVSPESAVNVEVGDQGINLESCYDNEEWEILSTSSRKEIAPVDGSTVRFAITMKRRPEYYFYNIVIPVMLMSLLAIFTFVIPIDSGEKLGFGTTVYLALVVFLTIVGDTLPVTSTQSLLSKYILFLVVIGIAIVMVTAIELRIHYRDSVSHRIPTSLKGLVRFSRKLQCQRSHKISDAKKTNQLGKDVHGSLPEQGRATVSEEMTWPDVTSAIDFVCFWLFLTTNIAVSFVLFIGGYIES
ncbi:Acetylcholine receptor subunit alpha-type unc-38 [Mizuhopecten yessoensis]|uniref:Acetylcholine receptor subunit alpha-type unc-38 n=1 Tax=Mizuhopecten yessoensis TaxID=6573 RepID=A0A210PSI3_MIZYE|nr:Acetylcholine receptor subunit alpha-type unc-38 [Mizuhopecten yessoensis]